MEKTTPAWLSEATWTRVRHAPEGPADDLPYVTHEGVWKEPLFGMNLRCYRLSNGQAVFHTEDFDAFMDRMLEA